MIEGDKLEPAKVRKMTAGVSRNDKLRTRVKKRRPRDSAYLSPEQREAIEDQLKELRKLDLRQADGWKEIENLKEQSATIQKETEKILAELQAR